jgi:hypothetical protein
MTQFLIWTYLLQVYKVIYSLLHRSYRPWSGTFLLINFLSCMLYLDQTSNLLPSVSVQFTPTPIETFLYLSLSIISFSLFNKPAIHAQYLTACIFNTSRSSINIFNRDNGRNLINRSRQALVFGYLNQVTPQATFLEERTRSTNGRRFHSFKRPAEYLSIEDLSPVYIACGYF